MAKIRHSRLKAAFLSMLCFLPATNAWAQRFMDKLDRGLVATIAMEGSGNFISWRIQDDEYYDVTYNLYANGKKIASNLRVSNFVDPSGNASTEYTVAPVVRGKEGEQCAPAKRWTHWDSWGGRNMSYIDIPGANVIDRRGNTIAAEGNYEFNDSWAADVDGDGQVEIIAERIALNVDPHKEKEKYNRIECYKLDGTCLWSMDIGPNMQTGPDGQWSLITYDWDMDGKAEVILRGANNMRIYHKDGTHTDIGNMSYDSRDIYDSQYTFVGDEFLIYLNGETGKPYPIGPKGELWMDYPLPRVDPDEEAAGKTAGELWGDGTGHRGTKHYFAAPYLDGHKPSIFLGRGCYTRHKFCALDVDPTTHKLTQVWRLNFYEPGAWFGQGYHNFGVGDVDMDGRDEIMFGSMTIDDNGYGLSTSGLGHGDAQHLGDFDPYRWGLEQFACLEHQPAMNYRNATTSELYYRIKSSGDDGRAMAGNFYDEYPGAQGQSSQTTAISLVADKQIPNTWVGDLAFRIYWDGDLCDEILNSPGICRNPKIDKPGYGRLFLFSGNMNNGSKNNPCLTADILGDWREELMVRCGSALRIFTSPFPTDYRITSLWYDHQYRNEVNTESQGYNQPPHVSFFIGAKEGITYCPPSLTNKGRETVANGGTIGAQYNGKQVLFDSDETQSTVNITEGASPWVAYFNVPVWVKGTAESNTTVKDHEIVYVPSVCQVKGGAFGGTTRLVKQGEGELVLPAVEEKYTGATEVWNGTLTFDGKLKQSPLWLNRHTTLKSNGGEFRSITTLYNATILPGGDNTVGTITCDTLNLGFGSRIKIDMTDNGNDKVNTTVLTIDTKRWEYGPKYLAPVLEFVTSDVKEGHYDLGTVGKIAGYGKLEDIVIEGLGVHHRAALTHENGHLYLDVTPMRAAADVEWSGSHDNIWNLGRTENFLSGGNATYFATGDNVFFNDNAAVRSVDLKGDLLAGTVTFDARSNYILNGSGMIAGEANLVKKGDGMLTIRNNNSYTGKTLLSGGTVVVEQLSNENAKTGAFGAVSTDPSNLIMENGATINNTVYVTMGSPMTVRGEQGGCIDAAETFTMTDSIVGTVLHKKGNGKLMLMKNNPELDTLSIEGGLLHNYFVPIPAKLVKFVSGTLDDSNGSSFPILVPNGCSGRWNLVNRSIYSNTITGGGRLQIFCPTDVMLVPRTPLALNLTDFEGTIVADADLATGQFTFATKAGMANGTLEILDHVVVLNADGNKMRIGKLAGKGRLGGWVCFGRNGVYMAPTWILGNDEDFTFYGTIKDYTFIEKVGTGKMTLAGKGSATGAGNDFSGDITIKEGEVHVNKDVRLGTGKLLVGTDGTLSGVTDSLTNSSVTIDGTVQVGLIEKSYNGSMNFNNVSVYFNPGSKLVLGVYKKTEGDKIGGAYLDGINRMIMKGAVEVNVASFAKFVVGDTVRLWKAKFSVGSPTLTNYVIDEAKGLYWDDKDLKSGILRVTDKKPTSAIQGVFVDNSRPVDVYNLFGARVATGVEVSRLSTVLPRGIYILRQGLATRKITIK